MHYVDILGQRFSIKRKMSKESSILYSDVTLYGYCNRDKKYIYIAPNLKHEEYYRTLFHEMGHALMYRNALAFSGLIPPEIEEILVETYASMQYEYIKSYIKKLKKLDDKKLRDELDLWS